MSTSAASAHVPFHTHSCTLADCLLTPLLHTYLLIKVRGSLPSVDLGGGKPCPISSASTPIQVGVSSLPGPIPLPSESVSALRLTADHTKEIFNLACKGHQLKERVMRRSSPSSLTKRFFFVPRLSPPATKC